MTDDPVEEAYRRLRGCWTGDLRFDQHVRGLRYVIEPAGRLVAPVMVAMLRAAETVLFVPEYAEDALELLVSLEELDEHGPHGGLTDRWRIHHRDPEDVRWGFFDVDSARLGEVVIDGASLLRPNPLAGDEAALCRWLNQRGQETLRRLCQAAGGIDVEQPVVVGVDPLGFDVRRRFDVVRVPAPAPMETADAVRAAVEQLTPAT
jgi:hypothetical protein